MHLFPLFLGVALLPEVYSLKCNECLPGTTESCTTKECLDDQRCASLRFTSYEGDAKVSDVNIRSCASHTQCAQGSVNFGLSKTVITTECCTTDLCNTRPAPVPSKSRPNGKKCFSCDGKECTGTVNCLGDEDYCVSTQVEAEGSSVTMKGCVSKMMCSPLDMSAVAKAFGSDIKCCQGDFCNSAASTGGSLLLVVVPLTTLFFFS